MDSPQISIKVIAVMLDKVFYITGRCGSLDKGLAKHLAETSNSFAGIAVDIHFLRQEPLTQVEQIRAAIEHYDGSAFIANSYGAYLLLQALVECPNPPKKVLLLSPVLGLATAKDRMYASKPPLTKRLQAAFENNTLTRPTNFSVIIGSQDAIYNEAQACALNTYFGESTVEVIEGEGHMLKPETVRDFLKSHL